METKGNTYIIQTLNLTRKFGDLLAVDKVSLSIRAGVVYGLLGPNGAGKTTLIRLLNGLLQPTSGGVFLFGKDIQKEENSIRGRCGAQTDTNLYEGLTAFENLEIWGQLYAVNYKILKQRVESLLKIFGLYERKNDLVKTYSRGMKQKLSIARALIHKPEILFLDEPTAGLDPEASEELLYYLKKYVLHNNRTVLLSTHRLEEAELLSEEIAIMNQGKLLAAGSIRVLAKKLWKENWFVINLKNPKEEFIETLVLKNFISKIERKKNEIRIALQDKARISEIVKILVSKGAEIIELREEKHSLKDIYLSLVPKENHEY